MTVLARFTFKPEDAKYFIDSSNGEQNVIEVLFESVEDLICTCKEFENSLLDCTAVVNGKIVTLQKYPVT